MLSWSILHHFGPALSHNWSSKTNILVLLRVAHCKFPKLNLQNFGIFNFNPWLYLTDIKMRKAWGKGIKSKWITGWHIYVIKWGLSKKKALYKYKLTKLTKKALNLDIPSNFVLRVRKDMYVIGTNRDVQQLHFRIFCELISRKCELLSGKWMQIFQDIATILRISHLGSLGFILQYTGNQHFM